MMMQETRLATIAICLSVNCGATPYWRAEYIVGGEGRLDGHGLTMLDSLKDLVGCMERERRNQEEQEDPRR